MTSNCSQRRRARERLYRRDPNCHWCRAPMVLIDYREFPKNTPRPDNAATLEHLRSRLDPERPNRQPGERRWVLACHKCNGDRAAVEEAGMPIEDLRRRSKRHQMRYRGTGPRMDEPTVDYE